MLNIKPIQILKIGLLITATQFLFANSCKKEGSTKPCINSDYEFSVTSEFSPQREVYNIGDTIYFNSTFPKNLLNTISQKQVDYINSVGIRGGISFSIMDTSLQQIKCAFSKFEMITFIGSFLLNNGILAEESIGINFIENTTNYQFKIGIKLKEKGLYQFGAFNLGSQGLKNQNCTNATFDMKVTNSNKNINLFQYALGYMPDALLQKSIYCFRVQ